MGVQQCKRQGKVKVYYLHLAVLLPTVCIRPPQEEGIYLFTPTANLTKKKVYNTIIYIVLQ